MSGKVTNDFESSLEYQTALTEPIDASRAVGTCAATHFPLPQLRII
jgi:hypothetical protein